MLASKLYFGFNIVHLYSRAMAEVMEAMAAVVMAEATMEGMVEVDTAVAVMATVATGVATTGMMEIIIRFLAES